MPVLMCSIERAPSIWSVYTLHSPLTDASLACCTPIRESAPPVGAKTTVGYTKTVVSVGGNQLGAPDLIHLPGARTATPGSNRVSTCSSGEGASRGLGHQDNGGGSSVENGQSATNIQKLRGECTPLLMDDMHRRGRLNKLPRTCN